jgi:hypothetical protein
MHGLLPPALDPASANARARPPRPALPSDLRPALIIESSDENHRAVGERLQVKLHDIGLALEVKRLGRAEFRAALASGGYDLALVSVLAIPEAGMAVAQLVSMTQGRDAAREELRLIGAGADAAARRSLAAGRAELLLGKLPLLPLYVQSPRMVARPGASPVGFDGSGAPLIADGWLADPRRGR